MNSTLTAEIAAAAARLVVEEGLEYGAAKRRAARDLSAGRRSVSLPGNDEVEDEVRAYIDLFRADSQPAELALIDMRVDYEVSSVTRARGESASVLDVYVAGDAPQSRVRIAFAVLDYDDLRGALRGDARGRPQRGDLAALRVLQAAA
jgi:hypothetical protein